MPTGARAALKATYLLERLVTRCAWEMGLSQDEIRRRNFIETFPYPNAGGCGTTRVTSMPAWTVPLSGHGMAAGFERKAASAARRLRGIGYSSYIEACGIAPSTSLALWAHAPGFECGEVGAPTNA